jgi:hypothetical protein
MAGEIGALFGFLIVIAVFALWVYASYWTYTDAKRRGSTHAFAWGLGVFLIGLLGLILYLVVRDDMGGRGRGTQY